MSINFAKLNVAHKRQDVTRLYSCFRAELKIASFLQASLASGYQKSLSIVATSRALHCEKLKKIISRAVKRQQPLQIETSCSAINWRR